MVVQLQGKLLVNIQCELIVIQVYNIYFAPQFKDIVCDAPFLTKKCTE